MLSKHQVITSIQDGGVGILPTDTVYGLVCSALQPIAVARLYDLKSRESKPGTIIAASIDQLVELGIRRRYLKVVEHFWPNSVSVIIPVGEELSYLHQGKRSLAVRIPHDDKLIALLTQSGPLLTTSANHPDQPTAATLTQAEQYFNGDVDFYLDGGDLSNNQPSTIIRIVDDAIEVIREGVVRIAESGEIIT